MKRGSEAAVASLDFGGGLPTELFIKLREGVQDVLVDVAFRFVAGFDVRPASGTSCIKTRYGLISNVCDIIKSASF